MEINQNKPMHRFISKTPQSQFTTISVEELNIICKHWNDRNRRPLSSKKALDYKYIMENKKWGIGASLVFDIYGNLIDGQHRAQAALDNEQPLTTYVNYGVPEENASTLDRHYRRTAAQAIGLEGPRTKEITSFGRCWIFSDSHFSTILSKMQDFNIKESVNRHKESIEYFAFNIRKHFKRAGFLTAMAKYYELDKQNATHFYDKITKLNEGVEENSPEAAMRSYLINTRGGGASRLKQDYYTTINMINSKHLGKKVTKAKAKDKCELLIEKI